MKVILPISFTLIDEATSSAVGINGGGVCTVMDILFAAGQQFPSRP
jgi:hypothetical protein